MWSQIFGELKDFIWTVQGIVGCWDILLEDVKKEIRVCWGVMWPVMNRWCKGSSKGTKTLQTMNLRWLKIDKVLTSDSKMNRKIVIGDSRL